MAMLVIEKAMLDVIEKKVYCMNQHLYVNLTVSVYNLISGKEASILVVLCAGDPSTAKKKEERFKHEEPKIDSMQRAS